jgi:hypothetical protein
MKWTKNKKTKIEQWNIEQKDNHHYWNCSALGGRRRLFKKSLNCCSWHWNFGNQTRSPLVRNWEICPCSGVIGEEGEVVMVSVKHVGCGFQRESCHWKIGSSILSSIWGFRVLRSSYSSFFSICKNNRVMKECRVGSGRVESGRLGYCNFNRWSSNGGCH